MRGKSKNLVVASVSACVLLSSGLFCVNAQASSAPTQVAALTALTNHTTLPLKAHASWNIWKAVKQVYNKVVHKIGNKLFVRIGGKMLGIAGWLDSSIRIYKICKNRIYMRGNVLHNCTLSQKELRKVFLGI